MAKAKSHLEIWNSRGSKLAPPENTPSPVRILGLQERHMKSAPVRMCIFSVLVSFGDVYFLDILGAFPMHFLRKSVFFFTLLVPVSRRGVFLFTPWAPLSCAGVIVLRLCENWTRTLTAGVFSYPRVVYFFGKRIFRRQLWKQNPHFCCMCILAAYVVLKSSVPFICFRIVRVSTRF